MSIGPVRKSAGKQRQHFRPDIAGLQRGCHWAHWSRVYGFSPGQSAARASCQRMGVSILGQINSATPDRDAWGNIRPTAQILGASLPRPWRALDQRQVPAKKKIVPCSFGQWIDTSTIAGTIGPPCGAQAHDTASWGLPLAAFHPA